MFDTADLDARATPRTTGNTFATPTGCSTWEFEPLVGGKTGYDNDAGYCLIEVARRDGNTMISVTLDGDRAGRLVRRQPGLARLRLRRKGRARRQAATRSRMRPGVSRSRRGGDLPDSGRRGIGRAPRSSRSWQMRLSRTPKASHAPEAESAGIVRHRLRQSVRPCCRAACHRTAPRTSGSSSVSWPWSSRRGLASSSTVPLIGATAGYRRKRRAPVSTAGDASSPETDRDRSGTTIDPTLTGTAGGSYAEINNRRAQRRPGRVAARPIARETGDRGESRPI